MLEITGKPEIMKKMNITILYKSLIELHTATRAEISERTKISATTVRSLLEELLKSGEIVELTLDKSSGGRRAQRYMLNPNRNLILSLYFEEKFIEYQVSSLVGDNIECGREIRKDENISMSVKRFLDKCLKKWSICAIGLGVPGIVEKGKYYVCDNINLMFANNLGEEIQNIYHIPVILENDLNAIALGFALHHAEEKHCDIAQMNIVYVHFNMNCSGAGIIVDGQIVHGEKRFAGEVGFLPILPDKNVDTALYEASDPKQHAEIIARLIAIINCIANPSLVVIGGNRFDSKWKGLEIVKTFAKSYIGGYVLPEITFCNVYKDFYLKGLTHLTVQSILSFLPIGDKEG